MFSSVLHTVLVVAFLQPIFLTKLFYFSLFLPKLPVLAAAPDISLPSYIPRILSLYFYILIIVSYTIYEGPTSLLAIPMFTYLYPISNTRFCFRICLLVLQIPLFHFVILFTITFFITHLSSLQLQTYHSSRQPTYL